MSLTTVNFKTEFAVDMTCQNCVEAVSGALRNIPGIERYDIDLEKKQVVVTGKTPPSQLLSALKSTNRQVIVRGTSSTDNKDLPIQAAVAILESPLPLPTQTASTRNLILADLAETAQKPLPGMTEEEDSQKVFGICRFVQIAPKTVVMDLTVRLPHASRVGLGTADDASNTSYNAYISSTGNIINPPTTTGKPYYPLGSICLDKDGYGDIFKELDGELWEWIGRGCVIEASNQAMTFATSTIPDSKQNEQSPLRRIFAGVIARSAGAWGNDKTVCACSGKTMWEEGRVMEQKKF
ncbi:hypothetical protein L204_101474 [Cryptococcus depauperatus]|nr:copper chaperone [Cryptococcus depauperatus CBS 7855]